MHIEDVDKFEKAARCGNLLVCSFASESPGAIYVRVDASKPSVTWSTSRPDMVSLPCDQFVQQVGAVWACSLMSVAGTRRGGCMMSNCTRGTATGARAGGSGTAAFVA